MSLRTIAVLSPGEMGSQVGRALHQRGSRVICCVAGRSDRTAERATAAGFELLPTLDEVVQQAELIIAVVPSLSARPLADEVASAMRRTGEHPLYVDANSIGPQTALAIADAIEAAGGSFVDGSIIGSAGELLEGATFYLSGARAQDVAEYLEPPLHTSILGTEPGQASGFKVLYAGLTKGLSALGLELLAGAQRLGLTDMLLDKYRSSHPSVVRFWEHNLPGLPPRAGRRSEEMIELAETLEGLGLTGHMAQAAHICLADLARRYRQDGAPEGLDLGGTIEWLARRMASATPGEPG